MNGFFCILALVALIAAPLAADDKKSEKNWKLAL
jgi:hypothetical protein